MKSSIEFPSLDLVRKYDKLGSFYTDYPALGLWRRDVGELEYREAFSEMARTAPDLPLTLYFHFPFCAQQCYYCMCFSIITRNNETIERFLSYTSREIDLLLDAFDRSGWSPKIKKIHFGGGSPSQLDEEQFGRLVRDISRLVDFATLEECAIEIDPRQATPDKLHCYSSLGINRISLGVQEFNRDVQAAINRIQPLEMVAELLQPELRKLFKSVNFDIIYGMPRQTCESFRETMQEVIRLAPDRMGVCVLGWRPDIFKQQRLINEPELPTLEESACMNFMAIEMALAAGYEKIGIDHYAKPTEDLAVAKRAKSLHRSTMGYNPGHCIQLIGLGPSGMNRLLHYYFQRDYTLEDYYTALDHRKFPILRGYKLNRDLQSRRDIMERIICYGRVDFSEIEAQWALDFTDYFAADLQALDALIADGILTRSDHALQVTPIGEFFLRHVCAAFDVLLREGTSYKHARDTA